jgi:hypothetical protein
MEKDELCSMEWSLKLMYDGWPEDRVVKARFYPDYTYVSCFFFFFFFLMFILFCNQLVLYLI